MYAEFCLKMNNGMVVQSDTVTKGFASIDAISDG